MTEFFQCWFPGCWDREGHFPLKHAVDCSEHQLQESRNFSVSQPFTFLNIHLILHSHFFGYLDHVVEAMTVTHVKGYKASHSRGECCLCHIQISEERLHWSTVACEPTTDLAAETRLLPGRTMLLVGVSSRKKRFRF